MQENRNEKINIEFSNTEKNLKQVLEEIFKETYKRKVIEKSFFKETL